MDCRDPEYMNVRIEGQSPYYEAYSDATSTIHGNWIPAQICREQTDIYPKGGRQDSLT